MNLSLALSLAVEHTQTHTTGSEWLIWEKYQTLRCRNITALRRQTALWLAVTHAHTSRGPTTLSLNQRQRDRTRERERKYSKHGRGGGECKCRQKISRFVLAKRLIHAHPRIAWRGRRHGSVLQEGNYSVNGGEKVYETCGLIGLCFHICTVKGLFARCLSFFFESWYWGREGSAVDKWSVSKTTTYRAIFSTV